MRRTAASKSISNDDAAACETPPLPSPDNLTPVGSIKRCFAPRSNFPESKWPSYGRFTNERKKSSAPTPKSDFDLQPRKHWRDPGSLGSRRSPEAKHSAGARNAASYLFWLPQNTTESKASVEVFIVYRNAEMQLTKSEILTAEVSSACCSGMFTR